MSSYHLFRDNQYVGHSDTARALTKIAQVGDYAFVRADEHDSWYKYGNVKLQGETYKNFTRVTTSEVPESIKLAVLLVV